MLTAMLGRIDLALRFVYVAFVPFVPGLAASRVPSGGVVGGTAVGTAVALIGRRRWHAHVDRLPLVGRVLGGFGRLGEYYAEHPPRPLLYYVLYPALFPYWLFVKHARAELVLYRRLSLITMLILAITGIVDYFRKWT